MRESNSVGIRAAALRNHRSMGKVRRGGDIIKAITRHGMFMSDANEKPIGRLSLETLTGMEGWQPSKKLLQIITDLQREGRL